MMRVVTILMCTLMFGCGSCLEDKKVPEVEQDQTAKDHVRLVRTEAGVRAFDLGEGRRLSNLLDGGRDAGSN